MLLIVCTPVIFRWIPKSRPGGYRLGRGSRLVKHGWPVGKKGPRAQSSAQRSGSGDQSAQSLRDSGFSTLAAAAATATAAATAAAAATATAAATAPGAATAASTGAAAAASADAAAAASAVDRVHGASPSHGSHTIAESGAAAMRFKVNSSLSGA
jgi:trimeric autotransporter adhesin